ncbi:cache domain-containing sensor histidine kinase [Parasphaerochaeta coccoides]|uniref:histidine kinase n=1 Tax=Parasphaerochaeta coccoides (strain ATCC BAA-1237 / DSM 17374 / SPN1) TaxID=760011 RepID=F4GHL7_PARC1|nr:histidine kinase [Parasphaerochaeta coccoides]AEC02606.1 multi-sensor signal transduction histidine kinase [Parasphaerochaeta coccoides DSM 17374]
MRNKKRDKIRDRSIKSIITLAIATISIAFILIISIVLYSESVSALTENSYVMTKEVVYQVNTNLDYYLSGIISMASYVKNMVRETEEYPSGDIIERILPIIESRSDIETIALLDADGQLVFSSARGAVKASGTIREQLWFTRAVGTEGNYYFTGPHVQNLFTGQYPWVISYSQEITYVGTNGERSPGILLIDMNFSAVRDITDRATLGRSGYVYLVDNEGGIVFHPRQQLINAGLLAEDTESVQDHVFGSFINSFAGRKRLTVVDTVSYSRWRIVGIAFMDEITDQLTSLSLVMSILVVICVFVAVFIARLVSTSITRPIKKLERLMKQVEGGNMMVDTDVRGNLEVRALSRSFGHMISRIRKLMDDIVRVQEMKRKSEMDAMQAKINPHFLYNTLDSVVWLAEQGDTQSVIRMISALARLFRISISKGHDIITLGEELEHVGNYLFIQQMRYVNKFEFTIDLPDDLKNKPTIKLIVQPIVENCIYHGIKYLQEMGRIDIRVFRRPPGALVIEIKDNGVGMIPEVFDRIMEPRTTHSSSSNGIGVRNVSDRIKLYHGNDYGLEIQSEADIGTIVQLVIPEGKDIPPIKVAKK